MTEHDPLRGSPPAGSPPADEPSSPASTGAPATPGHPSPGGEDPTAAPPPASADLPDPTRPGPPVDEDPLRDGSAETGLSAAGRTGSLTPTDADGDPLRDDSAETGSSAAGGTGSLPPTDADDDRTVSGTPATAPGRAAASGQPAAGTERTDQPVGSGASSAGVAGVDPSDGSTAGAAGATRADLPPASSGAERTAVPGEPGVAGPSAAGVTPGAGAGGIGPAAPGYPGPGGGGGGYVPPGPAGPPAGGPPPPYQPIRRLQRSRERRVVAGVAGGLGEYTGVDPVLFRVLFAVLSVFGGAGILLYLLGWLFLPAAGEPVSPVESLIGRGGGRRTGDVVQVVLLVLVGLVLAGVLARGDGGDIFLLLVVVAGIVLLVRNLDERRDGRPPAPPVVPPPPPAYQPYEPNPYPPYDPTRTAAMPAGPVPTATAAWPEPVVAPVPVKAPKERSILGRVTLSALLLVLGVTAALDAGGAIEPQARHYLALSVGVLGLGLVVGAWRGRARGLVWLGIPLTVALAAVSTAEVSLDGGAGDRLYQPQSVAEVQDDYRIGVGSLRLDLTDVDFTSRAVTTSVSAGIGNVEVVVPREVDVEVVGRAGIGEVALFGQHVDGGSRERTVVDDGPDGEGGGSLQLVLDVGVGRVEVDRAAA